MEKLNSKVCKDQGSAKVISLRVIEFCIVNVIDYQQQLLLRLRTFEKKQTQRQLRGDIN